jgi:hypothetical protein
LSKEHIGVIPIRHLGREVLRSINSVAISARYQLRKNCHQPFVFPKTSYWETALFALSAGLT